MLHQDVFAQDNLWNVHVTFVIIELKHCTDVIYLNQMFICDIRQRFNGNVYVSVLVN